MSFFQESKPYKLEAFEKHAAQFLVQELLDQVKAESLVGRAKGVAISALHQLKCFFSSCKDVFNSTISFLSDKENYSLICEVVLELLHIKEVSSEEKSYRFISSIRMM